MQHHASTTQPPSEFPDSLSSVLITELPFDDYLAAVAATQPAAFDLDALDAHPWPLPPARSTTNNGA